MRDGGGSATVGASGLDEDMEAIRSEMRRFGKAEVVDQAHEWHLKNAYIPMEIVTKMAELGVQAIAAYAKDGTKPSTSPGLDFFDTGVQLVTDKPVDGVTSISSADGSKVCWG